MLPGFNSLPECPVEPAVQKWIESRFDWLIDQFGVDRLHATEVILPTEDYFPDAYSPGQADARLILDRVCGYVGLDPETVELYLYEDRNPHLNRRTAGLYEVVDGKHRVWAEIGNLEEPWSLVATLAHELAHVHLLGHGRVSQETADQEQLTDLLTVFLGLGVFTANAVVRESTRRVGAYSSWSISRAGYLTMPHFGYALALFARARGEEQPAWAKHLRPDVSSEFDKARQYLAATPYAPKLSDSIPPFPVIEEAAEAADYEGDAECLESMTSSTDEIDDSTTFSKMQELLNRYKRGERDFQNADLHGSLLCRAVLSGSDLTHADLYGADLTGAVLMKTDLHDSDLRFAKLHRANLRGANVSGVDFSGANLAEANLKLADIRGTDFTGACLDGAKLVGAIRDRHTNFTDVSFSQMQCDVDLHAELTRNAQAPEMLAGHYRGPLRWLIVFGIWSVGVLLGAAAGCLAVLFFGYATDNPHTDPASSDFGATVGAIVGGLVTFWKMVRKKH
jgi:uncharacterized protein YjbI with pentapeptide repeats